MEDYEETLEGGVELAMDGDMNGAVKLFEKAISIDPADIRGHINMGHALCELNKDDEALKSYTIAIENGHPKVFDPIDYDRDYPKAFEGRGLIYLKRGLLLEALNDLFSSCDNDPHNPEIFFHIGRVMSYAGRWREFIRIVLMKSDAKIPGAKKYNEWMIGWLEGNVTQGYNEDELVKLSFNRGAKTLEEDTIETAYENFPFVIGSDFISWLQGNNEAVYSEHVDNLKELARSEGAAATPISLSGLSN